jgi:hypothetical protein
MATPSEPSQTTSFYDEGMFMCEPCISSSGGNMCVYGSDAPVDVNDFDNQEDPHSYDPSYYKKYDAKPLQQTRSKFKIPRLTAGKPGDPFPMCAGDAVSQCFFNESGHGRVSVDNCMTAVFEPVSDNPAYQLQSNRNTQRMKPSQATMLAAARTASCPYFVCNTKSMRGGNGKMSFNATDCRCSSSNTFNMQNQ